MDEGGRRFAKVQAASMLVFISDDVFRAFFIAPNMNWAKDE